MTRLEWFNNQTPELQEKFKHNCNTLNDGVEFFEPWVNNGNITKGIGGAFAFYGSKEGHDFWHNISIELQKIQKDGE